MVHTPLVHSFEAREMFLAYLCLASMPVVHQRRGKPTQWDLPRIVPA